MLCMLVIVLSDEEFETDSAALASILDDTGIPDPPKPQLHTRHTLAVTPKVCHNNSLESVYSYIIVLNQALECCHIDIFKPHRLDSDICSVIYKRIFNMYFMISLIIDQIGEIVRG